MPFVRRVGWLLLGCPFGAKGQLTRGGSMDIRRVATGHGTDGNSVFVSDDWVAPVTLALMPGSEFHQVWGADSTRTFPDDGSRPEARTYFPPLGGFRFGFFTIPPDGGSSVPADIDVEAAVAEIEQKLPGAAGHFGCADPGLPTTVRSGSSPSLPTGGAASRRTSMWRRPSRRSSRSSRERRATSIATTLACTPRPRSTTASCCQDRPPSSSTTRSEEHTSELQS